MNNFKFLTGEYQPQPTIQIAQTVFQSNNIEFCFQFDDEAPVSFATGPNDLHFHISPTPNGNITFNNNGRTFKLFARERQNG